MSPSYTEWLAAKIEEQEAEPMKQDDEIADFVCRCRRGELIHTECERCRPEEIDYEGQ